MTRWAALALLVTACAQQAPAPVTTLPDAVTRIEVLPAQKVPDAVPALEASWQGTGVGLPVKPLAATVGVTLAPAGATTLSEVRQITVTFDVSNALAPNVAAVEFVDPNGLPYHRDEAPIGVAPPAVDHLSFELPVAATAIDFNKMSGVWAVRLLIDSQAVASQNFELLR